MIDMMMMMLMSLHNATVL